MKVPVRKIRCPSLTRSRWDLVALLMYWAFVPMGSALDPAKTVFQYSCQTWRRHNGLSANGIHAITQTKDGFIWLGTQKGLIRYDGLEFKAFTLPSLPLFEHQ